MSEDQSPNLPPSQRERKRLRQEKRILKRAGNKRLRRRLKQDLADDPETAHFSDVSHDRYITEHLNGQDAPGKPDEDFS